MTQTRALQITFVQGYGFGVFPYVSVLQDIARARSLKEFDQFTITNHYGRVRARFEGDSLVEHEEVAMLGVLRSDRFTGAPLASTVDTLNKTQKPVLEITWPEGIPRVYYPERYRAVEPYTGRVYEMFKSDCYSLCRDYILAKLGEVAMPVGTLNTAKKNAELFGRDFLMDAIREMGFCSVLNPVPGDLIIIGAEGEPQHAAVLLKDNMILHHYANRMSCIEPYDGYWRDQTTGFLRHIGKN